MSSEMPVAPPLHGFRGDPPATPPPRPRGLTVVIEHQIGSRGEAIAEAVGHLLGWQVFDADLMSLLATDPAARGELLAGIPDAAVRWADSQTAADPQRLTFALAARGDAVLVGEFGDGLPADSTVRVRVVASEESRVAYLAQQRRLTPDEARTAVRAADRQQPADPLACDAVLNARRLGVAGCAEVIAAAVRVKQLPADGL